MADINETISMLQKVADGNARYWVGNNLGDMIEVCGLQELTNDAIELLRPLAEPKRPDNLRERRAGRTRVHLGDCPVCHRVVEFAQKHCHNCVQLLDWTEVLEMTCEDEDSSGT